MTAFGKSCIDLGSDLNEVQNVVDVTFKKMSGDMDKWAKGAAKNYGLSETMAKKYAGLYGSMAEAFGFSEKAAYEMSTTLTGLAGDVASFYNIDQDAAYTKLKAVFSGETEALKDLGIVMTQSALDNFALQQGMGKTVAQMSEAEKVSLRYRFILDQLKNATGDFARTSNGWANQVRILKLNFDSLKASIGQGLIRAVSPALKVVNNLIGRVQVLADSFNNMIGSVFGTDADAANAVNSTAVAEQELADSANQSAAAVDGVTDSINKSAKAAEGSLASFDKLNLLSFNKPDEDSDAASSADTGTTAAVTGGFSKQMDKVADKISERWKKRSEKLVSSVKQTLDKIKTAVKKVGTSWRDVWRNGTGDKILDNTASLLSNIFGIIGDVAGAFTKAWDNAGKGDAVVQAIYDKWNSLISLLDTIAADFREVWNDGTGERIWGNILTIIQNCNRYTATWREKIKKAWEHNENGKRIWETILGIVEDVTGFFAELSEMRLEWLEDLDLDPIVGSVADLGEAFRELLKACGDKLKGVYKDVLLPLGKWTIEKGLPKLIEGVAKAFEWFGKVIKKIPQEVVDGLAAGIIAIVVAVKAGKVVYGISQKISKGIGLIASHPYLTTILALTGAIVGIVTAIKKYQQKSWENSSLKKEVDKIDKYSDELKTAADNMKEAVDTVNQNHIEVKADVSQIETLKSRLQDIIKDGVISKDEIPEYQTVLSMLQEVDGFDQKWSELDLSEDKEGNIIINSNIDDVNKELDDLLEKWERTMYTNVLQESYTTFSSNVQKYQKDIEKAQENIESARERLWKYTTSRGTGFDSFEDWYKAYSEGRVTGLGQEEQALVDSYEKATSSLLEYTTALKENQDGKYGSYHALQLLNDGTKDYSGALYMVESGLMDEQTALSMLGGTADITMQELKALAEGQRRQQDETTKSTKSNTGKQKDALDSLAKRSNKDASSMKEDIKGVGKSTGAASTEFKTGADKISGHLATLVQNFRDKLGGLPSESISWGRAVLENFKQGIMEKEGSVFDKVAEFVSGISSRLNTELNVTGGATAGLTIGLSAINAIPMATGRVVKAPTLAVVGDNPGAGSGDPEVVAPLSKLKTMMAGTGAGPADSSETNSYLKRIYEMLYLMSKNGGGSYQFVAEMNGSTLFKEMVRQNDLYKKRFGHSAF